jgi:hypothetical protein
MQDPLIDAVFVCWGTQSGICGVLCSCIGFCSVLYFAYSYGSSWKAPPFYILRATAFAFLAEYAAVPILNTAILRRAAHANKTRKFGLLFENFFKENNERTRRGDPRAEIADTLYHTQAVSAYHALCVLINVPYSVVLIRKACASLRIGYP